MWTEAYAGAQNPAGGAPEAPGIWNLLPMMVAMVVIIYFFMIRPQSKRQKETQKMLDEVKKGDKVITAGGIFGLVTRVKGSLMTIKIAPETEVEFKKSAVAAIVTPEMEKELNTEKEKK